MSLPPQFLDELRARTLLSALIARTVRISKVGREFKGCCPFHNEKTPSFYVNDEKGFYHCFGCSAHGDAIRWMTDQRGLGFMDAVKELADAAGMEVPAPDPRAAERAERANSLYDVMAAAQDWFSAQLDGIEGAEARTYLEKRGIKPATVKAFGIGFAPDARGKLKSALAHFGEDKLIESGLLIQVEAKDSYDRFRGRLMIPIRDARGRVIAFGGRILGTGEPKYLNSPDTPLFDKGRTLYNLDRASPASRKTGRVIAVEGYLDVIALSQHGIDEVVAPLGTALTETQIARLWQMADTPILCFDGDSAGQKAAVRAAHRSLPGLLPDRSLSFASLPHGLDPDDLVRQKGAEAFNAVVGSASPLSELLWATEEMAQPLDTPEAKAGLRQRLYEHSFAIRDETVRTQYQAMFNNRLSALIYPNKTVGKRFLEASTFRTTASYETMKRIAQIGLDQAALIPAVLTGLTYYPDLIARHSEALVFLPIVEPKLESFRDSLVEIALGVFPLDAEILSSELKRRDQVKTLERIKTRKRMRWSFLKSDADLETAERDLGLLIEQLASNMEVKTQLEILREHFQSNSEWSFTELAEQDRLRKADFKGMEDLRNLREQAEEQVA